jgi:hypothetical protein
VGGHVLLSYPGVNAVLCDAEMLRNSISRHPGLGHPSNVSATHTGLYRFDPIFVGTLTPWPLDSLVRPCEASESFEGLIEEFDHAPRSSLEATRPLRGRAGAKRLPGHGHADPRISIFSLPHEDFREPSENSVRSDRFRWPPRWGGKFLTSRGSLDATTHRCLCDQVRSCQTVRARCRPCHEGTADRREQDRCFPDPGFRRRNRGQRLDHHQGGRRGHGPHHSWVSFPMAMERPLKMISDRLGHAPFCATSNVYGHLLPGSKAKAAAARDSVLLGFALELVRLRPRLWKQSG